MDGTSSRLSNWRAFYTDTTCKSWRSVSWWTLPGRLLTWYTLTGCTLSECTLSECTLSGCTINRTLFQAYVLTTILKSTAEEDVPVGKIIVLVIALFFINLLQSVFFIGTFGISHSAGIYYIYIMILWICVIFRYMVCKLVPHVMLTLDLPII